MTAFFRKIFMIFIGLIAGTASWAVIELLLSYGETIGSYLLWNSLAGAFIGLFFGLLFGSAEGIMLSDLDHSIRGGLLGGAFGLLGGTIAVILAQALLYALGNAEFFTNSVSISLLSPISRALGWSLLGLIIGSIDGIKSHSVRRMWIGASGGVLGGLAGGLLLEILTAQWSNGFIARGIGLSVMGAGIGLFYTLFEFSSSYGLLRVLTGPLRGKEYVLVMKKTKIGSSSRSNIPLGDYSSVVGEHALLISNRHGVIIQDAKGPVLVNDQPVLRHELKYEDVIQIGDAKLFYLPG